MESGSRTNNTHSARQRPQRRTSNRSPSIGIRRQPAHQSLYEVASASATPGHHTRDAVPDPVDTAPRRRSSSDPRPVPITPATDGNTLAHVSTRPEGGSGQGPVHMPVLREEVAPSSAGASWQQIPTRASVGEPVSPPPDRQADTATPSRVKSTLRRLRPGAFDSLNKSYIPSRTEAGRVRGESDASRTEYDADLVDLLDVIDPEISTLSTLTNVQNSLFVPDLGSWLNRRPTYNLSALPPRLPRRTTEATSGEKKEQEETIEGDLQSTGDDAELRTLDSRLSDSRFAVLPHGVTLAGWTEEEKEQLDDHVRHMLHSKWSAFKRGMKGFKQYVSRPLGFFVTLYAFLITSFGLAWVLFLIGWINLGEKRDYVIDVVDNVLVALFAVVGDGLIPWRIVDTYHMIYIAHYHHLTWRLRKVKKLPKLPNHNDLPTRISLDIRRNSADSDHEAARPGFEDVDDKDGEFSVLTPEQQRKLEHHQAKFSKSHTFYKPHETETHSAFPLRLLVAIVVILDFHSIFQVALGTCTWSIPYQTRPFALTTTLLCCSLACNITGGVLVSIGDRRTRKKEVRERMFRQELTTTAIKKVEKRRQQKERRPSGDAIRLARSPAESATGSDDAALTLNEEAGSAHLMRT